MESLQKIKTRRRAVKNIWQMTRAMELVAATKMRKSQMLALNSRPYAFKALELLAKIEKFSPLPIPLAEERKITKTLIVLVSSDRGLIGPFNALVFKAFERFIVKDKEKMIPEHKYLYLAIGKKSEAFLNKKN